MRRPESRVAAELLGPSHPLVATLELFEVLVRQSAVAVGALAGSAVGLALGIPHASSFVGVSAAVELALYVGLAMTVQTKRSRARDLIVEGLEALPLRCVAFERRKLARPASQRRLARLLDRAVDAAENWERIGVASRPPQAIRRIRPAAPELRALAAALRANEMSVRAVALAARMLAGGYASPFYTGHLDELRDELTRIRHLA